MSCDFEDLQEGTRMGEFLPLDGCEPGRGRNQSSLDMTMPWHSAPALSGCVA